MRTGAGQQKGVQRVELLGKKGENLHQLRELCVSLKGGTRLFGGGDPRCLHRKGTAHCLRAGSPGEVIKKVLIEPVRMVQKSKYVKATTASELMGYFSDLVVALASLRS